MESAARPEPAHPSPLAVLLWGALSQRTHPDTEGLFLVLSGELIMQLRDRDVILGPNDVFVVPRGVEHCPKADEEVEALSSNLKAQSTPATPAETGVFPFWWTRVYAASS